MFGLLIIIAMYVFLGFMLAWIAQVVAREEVEVKTGVIILVLTAIIGYAVQAGAAAAFGSGAALALGTLSNFAALIVLLNLVAKLSWKHSAIIAAIYTVLIFAAALGIGLLIAAAG